MVRTEASTAADSNGQQPSQLESALSGALSTADVHSEHEYTRELLGLWLCEETRADCDISVSTELDSDGDGIDNDADNCPDSYNPGQDNLDGDTLGDSCDSCPLVPESSSCDHDPSDVDDDGTENCPWIHNPDQSNVDGDDEGDVCDLCPT